MENKTKQKCLVLSGEANIPYTPVLHASLCPPSVLVTLDPVKLIVGIDYNTFLYLSGSFYFISLLITTSTVGPVIRPIKVPLAQARISGMVLGN